MPDFLIRPATPHDYDGLGVIFFEAVRYGKSPYSESQRGAWAPEPRSGADWHNRLRSQAVFVAENPNAMLGFMSLADGGYVDLAYIRPNARGDGMFRSLYDTIESLARRNNVERLWTHSSLTAQPAFRAVGFSAISDECVQIGDVWLDRVEMEKSIGAINEG